MATHSSILGGFPGGSEGKVSACNAGDLGLIPGSGRSPGEGNGDPLQYSCLENPMDCIAHQAPLSTGFSRQEYWGGLPFPPPGDLPDPGIEPMSPALAGRFFTITDTWEAPVKSYSVIKNEMLPFVTT